MTSNGVSAGKLLNLAYRHMFKGKTTRIHLPKTISTKIGDDSDPHKTREAFMDYDLAKGVVLEGKEWILSRGKTYGSWITGDIVGSIIAFPKDGWRRRGSSLRLKELEENKSVEDRIWWEGHYFNSGLVASTSDGGIVTFDDTEIDSYNFSGAVTERIRGLRNHVAKEARVNSELVSLSTMRPAVESVGLYTPEAINYLARRLEEAVIEKAKIQARG